MLCFTCLFLLKNSQLKTPINSGIAAGYAYFSPFHQIASDRGNFKYLSNGDFSQLPGFYGVVVSQAFANKYPEIVVSYLHWLLGHIDRLKTVPKLESLHKIKLLDRWIQPEFLQIARQNYDVLSSGGNNALTV